LGNINQPQSSDFPALGGGGGAWGSQHGVEARQPPTATQVPTPGQEVSRGQGNKKKGGKKGQGEEKQRSGVTGEASNAAAKQSQQNVDQMTKQMESIKITEGNRPHELRKSGLYPGNAGKPVKIEANHFKFLNSPKQIHQYSIQIQPPWKRPYSKKDQDLYRKVFLQWIKLLSYTKKKFAFNGNNVFYSTELLYDIPDVDNIEVEGDNTPLKFAVREAKYAATLQVTDELLKFLTHGRGGFPVSNENGYPHDIIVAIDCILSQTVKNKQDKFRTLGKNYFPMIPSKGQTLDIGFGKEVWFGTFVTARPYGWKDAKYLFTLNVDVANKPALINKIMINTQDTDCYVNDLFPRGNYGKFDHHSKMSQRDVRELESDLKGLKVRYELPDGRKRQYRVNGLKESADRLIIPDLKITVLQYFQEQFKMRLKCPKLPCVWLGPLNKTIYIPLEFCHMVAQPMPRGKKLSEQCTSTMIRGTAVNPEERKKKIMEGLRNSNMLVNDEFAIEFGISLDQKMLEVNGRILAPPAIEYKEKKIQKISEDQPGAWRTKFEYVDGKCLNKWVFMDFNDTSERDYENLCEAFRQVGYQVGLRVAADPVWFPTNNVNFEADFEHVVEKEKPDMIMIQLPWKTEPGLYERVKSLGDIKFQIPTQCVKQSTIFKRGEVNRQSIENIFLKMNSKLGGINHKLETRCRPDILRRPIMIMGADVSHAPPESKGVKPSLAAVVGSIDPSATKYHAQQRVQSFNQNEEIIQDMEGIARNLLMEFYQSNKNRKPEKIIMFRDGVSEGQFLKVIAYELAAIRKACKALQPDDYEPEITFVVVQKRHHTRFFPTDNNKYRRSGNVLAGTVVDKGINHPTEGDFFLVSHEGIQGTSRPTHYHVLWDESNMTADEMEKLTYYLCHLYSRCTRSVSYPAPTYYAHLLADRARKYHNAHRDKFPQRTEALDNEIKREIEERNFPPMFFV